MKKQIMLQGVSFCLILHLCAFLSACGQTSYFNAQDEEFWAETKDETDGTVMPDDPAFDTSAGENVEPEKEQAVEEPPDMIYVQIAGAVHAPGVFELPSGTRIFEAIEMAGGLTENADDTLLNQAESLTDGQKIYIYTKEEVENLKDSGVLSDADLLTKNRSHDGLDGGSNGLVNINTASKEELMTLAGIGEAKASAIIAYREKNGAFESKEDLKNISGIKDGVYSKIADAICVN